MYTKVFLSGVILTLQHPPSLHNRSKTFDSILKVTVSRDFLLKVFFSWITFPQAPDNHIWIISNIFENSRRYSQVKVHHWCQWHQRQICNRYQQHQRQILPPVSLVLLTPVANLPPVSKIPAANLLPVSTTPVANCHRYQRHQWQICQRSHWHRWQIIRTISGCRHLKVNLKAKIYIYVSSTTQRWPNKINKNFLIQDFFHLPPVSLTPVENLELQISPRIFEKFRNGLNGILWGWGETEHEKNQKQKISWHCPFKRRIAVTDKLHPLPRQCCT